MATNANETRETDIKKRRNVKRRCMVTFQRLFAAHRSCRFTLALPRCQGALHCFDVETDRDNWSHCRRGIRAPKAHTIFNGCGGCRAADRVDASPAATP